MISGNGWYNIYKQKEDTTVYIEPIVCFVEEEDGDIKAYEHLAGESYIDSGCGGHNVPEDDAVEYVVDLLLRTTLTVDGFISLLKRERGIPSLYDEDDYEVHLNPGLFYKAVKRAMLYKEM